MCVYAQLCPALCDPMDCSPQGPSVHGISQGKNTGVGCHFLLQGYSTCEAKFPQIGQPSCLRVALCPSGLTQCSSCAVLAFWPLMYPCPLFSVLRLEISHCSESPDFLLQEGHEKLRSDFSVLTVHLKRLGCYVSFTTIKKATTKMQVLGRHVHCYCQFPFHFSGQSKERILHEFMLIFPNVI